MPNKLAPTKPAALRRSVLSAIGHLSVTPTEAQLTGFEFALEHLVQAYYRWKSLCFRTVSDLPLSGEDVAVLNTIRMGDDPKALSEIGALLNRADMPNLQYALRKLARAGLIENAGTASRRNTCYRVTAAGRAATDAYAQMRAEIFMPIVDGDGAPIDFTALERTLGNLARRYEQAGHHAIMARQRTVSPSADAPARAPRAEP